MPVLPCARGLLAHAGHVLALFLLIGLAVAARAAVPAVALYYGDEIPVDEFAVFDITVVDPDHAARAASLQPGERFYAYVSVGEVHATRPYYRDIPDAWKLTRNRDWHSDVIDQSAAGWAEFFATRVIQPLWDRGYRGFFLDTLDSFRLVEGVDEAAQQRGLVQVIETLHARYAGIHLIVNRGFEIIGQVSDKIDMVAAESLYRRWNARARRYDAVPGKDRQWLGEQLRTVQQRYGLPVLVIDYVDPDDRELTRQTAERIRADGFIPWVSDAGLTTMGVGAIEVVPRRVLVLYSSAEAEQLNFASAHLYLQMPLNYMGYVADYVDIAAALPARVGRDRYAGIVSWVSGFLPESQQARFGRWLKLQVDRGELPVAIVGEWGLPVGGGLAHSLGLVFDHNELGATLRPQPGNPMLGFETEPPRSAGGVSLASLPPAAQGRAQPFVELTRDGSEALLAGAIMPWGGFVLDPYVLTEVPGTADQLRWVVNPFRFLRAALRLPDIPVPTTTTENGRRLLLVHVDGDGFPSLAEFPGTPLTSEVLLEQVLGKYPIPQTMSVIEAEVSPHGLYPESSARMESIARRMFALPWVEIGTHTFSHPFFLDPVARQRALERDPDAILQLPVPDYTLDVRREVEGSTRYINERLAPPGKPVKILQWPGNTAPDANWLRAAHDAGLLNINGGDTSITHANPSLTAVGSLGISKQGYLQVYAPITNENLYTNNWSGPFYGYEQVLETFELTGSPRRIKPVGIYYHAYAASKAASLRALRKVYDWAMAQPLHPQHVSDFILKVRDFQHFSVAREGDGWRLHGDGSLRTVRLPATLGVPDVTASRDVAGWRPGVDGAYVHMAGNDARLRTGQAPPPVPYLFEANARLAGWRDADAQRRLVVDFKGYVPLEFALANTRGCRVSVQGKRLLPVPPRQPLPDFVQSFRLADAAAHVDINCAGR